MNAYEIKDESVDQRYMRRALDLARNGLGWTNPNPMVGAVIVKDGCIIGEGWHTKCGNLHAEREAFAHCSEDLTGATIYVTLEPCCHWGKTPPCTKAIIENKIARVVIGAPDPNPLVAGKGAAQLREAGIEVVEGVLLEECRALNKVFFWYIQNKRPYVVAKYAMTLDGKIATRTGASRWITGEEARKHVHIQRHRFAAIMVGVNTIINDNSQLTCRLSSDDLLSESLHHTSLFVPVEDVENRPSHPARVVLDSTLRIPLSSYVVQTASEIPTFIATTSTDVERIRDLEAWGCTVLVTKACDGQVDLHDVMDQLGALSFDSVYVEGGPTVHASLAREGLINEVHAYVAPKIFGGTIAPGPVGGAGVARPDDALMTSVKRVERLGNDVFFECEVD